MPDQPDLLPGQSVTLAPAGSGAVEAEVVVAPLDLSLARLSPVKKLGLILLPVALVGLLYGGAAVYFDELRHELAPAEFVKATHPPDGAALYRANCANCHGPDGRGNGPAALTTPARYYGYEPFKFTDTKGTRIPTDVQLTEVLKRGIAGSSMPSYAHLSEDELKALVWHVRALTRQGRYRAVWDKAVRDYDDGGDEPDPVTAHHKADEACEVGEPVVPPQSFAPATPESLARGRAVYERVCQSCHGPTGAGDGPQVAQLKNDNGTPARPRNLLGGVFKGGSEKANLYHRVTLGIPGTPMPATPTLTETEMNDLLGYVQSLSQPGA